LHRELITRDMKSPYLTITVVGKAELLINSSQLRAAGVTIKPQRGSRQISCVFDGPFEECRRNEPPGHAPAYSHFMDVDRFTRLSVWPVNRVIVLMLHCAHRFAVDMCKNELPGSDFISDFFQRNVCTIPE